MLVHAFACQPLVPTGYFILAVCYGLLPGEVHTTSAPDFMNPVHGPGRRGTCGPATLTTAPILTERYSATGLSGFGLQPYLSSPSLEGQPGDPGGNPAGFRVGSGAGGPRVLSIPLSVVCQERMPRCGPCLFLPDKLAQTCGQQGRYVAYGHASGPAVPRAFSHVRLKPLTSHVRPIHYRLIHSFDNTLFRSSTNSLHFPFAF